MILCRIPITIVRSHEASAQSSGIWGAPTTILALAGTWGTAMIKHQAPPFTDRTQTFPEENYPGHLALAESLAVPVGLSKLWQQESDVAVPSAHPHNHLHCDRAQRAWGAGRGAQG